MNRLILRDFIAYLPARVIPALAALIGIPILTRLLAPAVYGEYLVVLTTLTLIGALSTSWIVSVVTRFRPIDTEGRLVALLRPFILVSIIGGIGGWFLIGFAFGGHSGETVLLVAGSVWLGTYTLSEYWTAKLRADEQALRYSFAICLRSVGGLATGIALIWWFRPDGSALLLGTAIASAIVILTRKREALARPHHAAQGSTPFNGRELLRYALPVALSNLCVSALSFSNRYIVQAFLGDEAVAVYGASYDIAERSIFFLNAMMLLSSSVMAVKMFEREGEDAAANMLSALLRFYLLLAAIVVTVASVLAADIVGILLPVEYHQGWIILPIVSAGALLVGILHRYSLVLSFHKRTDIVLLCTLIALATNLFITALCVPRYGIVGGALGALGGYAVWLIAIRTSVRKYRAPRFPWLSSLRVVLACALAGSAMHFISDGSLARMIVALGVGGVAYALCLVMFGEIAPREMRGLLNMVRS